MHRVNADLIEQVEEVEFPAFFFLIVSG